MPSFFLDNKEIPFEPGDNIIKAARAAGVYVPHFCAHPALRKVATCRMCLVDVVDMGNGRGIPKLQTACTTAAAEGMKVEQNSAKVKASREAVMEFLLVNHPLDCPICDQAGECDLQDIAYEFGNGVSTMAQEKRVYGKRDIGSFLQLERNRCIHCTRCVRFTKEITGKAEMGVFQRNHHLTVDTFIDQPLTDKFQGNLADLCPVGAITIKDFRFKKRVWKLEKTPSVCAECSTGCNIEVHKHEDEVYRLVPRQNHDVNRWWMCDQGRVGFHSWLNREKRLSEVSVQGKPADYAAAVAKTAEQLKSMNLKAGEAIVVGSNFSTNEELYALKQFADNNLAGAKLVSPALVEEAPESDVFIENLIKKDKSPNSRGLKTFGFEATDLEKLDWSQAKVVFYVAGKETDAWLKQVLKKAPFSVLITPFKTGFEREATVVIPAVSHLEKTGTYINNAGRIQRNVAAVRPMANGKDECLILNDLSASVSGTPVVADTPEAVLEEMVQNTAAFSSLKGQEIPVLGIQLD